MRKYRESVVSALSRTMESVRTSADKRNRERMGVSASTRERSGTSGAKEQRIMVSQPPEPDREECITVEIIVDAYSGAAIPLIVICQCAVTRRVDAP